MSMSTSGTSAALTSLRLVATTMVMAPLLVLLAVSFVLPTDEGGFAPAWAWGALAAVALANATIASTAGFKTVAIAPGTPADEARRVSLGALQGTTFLRCVLTEAVAFVGLALAFVVEDGALMFYVVAAVLSVLLSLLISWPSDRVVRKVKDSLEREGGQSGL